MTQKERKAVIDECIAVAEAVRQEERYHRQFGNEMRGSGAAAEIRDRLRKLKRLTPQ